MKSKLRVLIMLCLMSSVSLLAQMEKVIVETYYISDANDATDTTGSVLSAHSTTYRIYIDMLPGSKLTRIYGNSNHEWRISSDSVFYNHTVEGQTFGYNFNSLRFSEGVVPLDTWLTLGQASISKPSGKTYFGTLKTEDRNGSVIGGPVNNDGGSKPVTGGLLVNNDPGSGIPLTTSDGLDTMSGLPSGWNNFGIIGISGSDSTIFGSIKKGKQFVSRNAFVQCNGVMGVNRDSNQVLIAQLTTRGKLYFALNVEILDKNGNILEYVAKNGADSLSPGVTPSAYLNYPLPCGCTDPNYLEYSTAFGCMDSSACKTLAVLGCMDPLACNYNPAANINVQSICCYPGYCANLDISVVCPELDVNESHRDLTFEVAPNPVRDILTVKLVSPKIIPVSCNVFDVFGKLLYEGKMKMIANTSSFSFDVSGFPDGLYVLRLFQGDSCCTKKFIKNQ